MTSIGPVPVLPMRLRDLEDKLGKLWPGPGPIDRTTEVAVGTSNIYVTAGTTFYHEGGAVAPSTQFLVGLDELEAEYETEVYAAITRTASPEAVDVLLGLSPPDGPLGWNPVRSGLEKIASSVSADPVARRMTERALVRVSREEAN